MENLTPLLEQLAEKFGTTVEHLWEVMIAQSQIFVIFSTMFFIIAAILLIAMIIYSVWAVKTGNWLEDGHDFLIIFGWAIVFVFIVICFILLYDVITAIKNPEYWALEKIISFLN